MERILLGPLEDLIVGRRPAGHGGNSDSDSGGRGGNGDRISRGSCRGTALKTKKMAPLGGGGMRARVRYEIHLPDLSLIDRGKSQTLLEGTFLPTLHDHVI